MDPIGALRINDSLGSTLSLKYLVSNTNGLKCTFEKPHLTVIQEYHLDFTKQKHKTNYANYTMGTQWLYIDDKLTIQRLYNDFTLSINWLYIVYTLTMQWLYNAYTMTIKWLYIDYIFTAQRPHND